MHCILLATNETRKLGVLDERRPTALLPIVNRPMLALALEVLVRAGYPKVLVSLHERGGAIMSQFGNGRRWGAHITYVTQRRSLGSAGALRWAARMLDDTFLVMPTDCIIDLDVEAALAFHRAHGGIATLIAHASRGDTAEKPFSIDADGRVTAQHEGGLEATGAYIFEPAVLQFIPANTPFDCFADLLPVLLQENAPVFALQTHGYWNPLASSADYQEAQVVFLNSTSHDGHKPRVRYPSIEGREIAPGVWVGAHARIDRRAKLTAPLCIGDNAWIQADTDVGPNAAIGANVVLSRGATVTRSTVLDGTVVGQYVNVADRIVDQTTLVDTLSSTSVDVLDAFLLDNTSADHHNRGQRWLSAVLAAFLLLLALPIMVPLAIAVYLTCGQVFVRLPRTGCRGPDMRESDTIKLWAFQTRCADGTVCAVSRLMLRWELDRLPELWNVLRGDLDLVGVKPLHPQIAQTLDEEWHQLRNECAPGFTGLWYTQTDGASDLDQALVADAYYVATRTWRVDLALLLATPPAWLRRQWRARPRRYAKRTRRIDELA